MTPWLHDPLSTALHEWKVTLACVMVWLCLSYWPQGSLQPETSPFASQVTAAQSRQETFLLSSSRLLTMAT